jgi:hypothetical protein
MSPLPGGWPFKFLLSRSSSEIAEETIVWLVVWVSAVANPADRNDLKFEGCLFCVLKRES